MKELFRITVVQDIDNSLIAISMYDEMDDVFGTFAFAFIAFCKNMNMTQKEALKYLKQSIKLWENYGDLKDEHINS